MPATARVAGVAPSALTAEFNPCIVLIRAGGEVAVGGLEQRLKNDARLARLSLGNQLCRIAAKRPKGSYRSSVSGKSSFPLPVAAYPYELGYVYVSPEQRGNGFSLDLAREALSGARNAGVFATTRSNNTATQRTLRRLGFDSKRAKYPSSLGNETLQLYVRVAQRASDVTA